MKKENKSGFHIREDFLLNVIAIQMMWAALSIDQRQDCKSSFSHNQRLGLRVKFQIYQHKITKKQYENTSPAFD